MSAEYDGKQVVGIDLHRRRSVLVRMTEAGERLDSVRIDNDAMTLAAEIAKAGEHPQVVLEATYGWYWAVDVLADAGAEVHLSPTPWYAAGRSPNRAPPRSGGPPWRPPRVPARPAGSASNTPR
jgi:hypothetical protein